ncbi:MAG: hypothetical protein JO166_19970 [Deltaproteobacteria bacterium]|nr:hypothetical protein [Deltaproteobacteria bacterium]
MKARIFRIIGVIGLLIGMGSLSACFEAPYYPGYAYGGPGYGYPEAYPRYYPQYVPAPRSYAYNPRPYPHANWQNHERWEHAEHEAHEHNHHHDRF